MIINGIQYKTVNVYNGALTTPDCWVVSDNKIGSAHGEKKLYFGSKSQMMNVFTDNIMNCVILKQDLIDYMGLVLTAYTKNRPNYHYKFTNCSQQYIDELYSTRLKLIKSLNEAEFFSVNFQRQISGRRGYVKSIANVFQLLRQIALPLVSYISISELEDINDPQNRVYYWKLFVDYVQLVNPRFANKHVLKYGQSGASKRPGQATYRRKVIERFNGKCAITGADELDILVASHIKRYELCDKKHTTEHTDPENGILLSSLYDRLFDQGFITFDNNSNIVFSHWLSESNKEKLLLNSYTRINCDFSQKTISYLDFHRHHIFRG